MDTSSPGPSSANNNEMDIDNDLTSKFLSGQMSFADYSNEWYNCNDEEEIEDSKLTESDLQETKLVEKGLRKSTPRRKCRLSAALQGLMGEANLRFVRGDVEMAEKMCHEVIKQVPNVPEPYQTLAQIYERDPDKSLQFSLLAAHLGPSDANEWLRLAAVSKERNDYKQQMICYTQAIKAEPTRLDLHEMRIALLKHLEDTKYPIYNWNVSLVKCYHKIVSSLLTIEGETIIKYAKMAAMIYHSNKETEHMLEVMSLAYNKCSNLFTLENLNILLELLIVNKQYQTCLDIFVSKVGVEIEADITTVQSVTNEIEEQINYLNCTIPDNLAIDLKSKLLVCFIHLGAINLVQTLLQDFLSNDVEKAGDLYMDIEEALSAAGHHELAMKLLEPLVNNTSFDLGAVWLKHAECLYNLGRDDDALESYYKVLKHAPQHPEARRKLFTILEKRGCIEEALNILQQDYKYVVSASLLYEHCNILKKYNRMEKYLEVGEALLSKSFVKYRHEEELKICFRTKSATELIYNFRSVRGENLYNEDDLHFDEEDEFKFTRQQEWDFFTELLKVAYEQKNFVVMQRLAFGAATSKALAPYRLNIEFFAFQASILNNDFQNAFRFVREFAQKHPGSRTWNMLSFIMNSIEDVSHGKFLCRLLQKDTHIVKNLFLGNNFLVSGRYLVALKYFLEYHGQCREPFSALLIAITILVMAAQRTVDKHHNLIMQGISYLFTYHQLRKCPMESYYNLGRAYQMLRINNLAIEYYEKALECGPIAVCNQHGTIDLTMEIAFNLYLLYKEHSPNMARKYMLKYLVI